MDLPPSLSAKFINSFAYNTVQERIPRILTKVIDTCHRHIIKVQDNYGEEGRLDAISVISKLSRLRNEIMTDKALSLLHDTFCDNDIWNEYFKEYREVHGQDPSFFTASWLYVECFVYRKISSILSNSDHMKDFDPFGEQKSSALFQSIDAINNLSIHLDNILKLIENDDKQQLKQHFMDLLQVSLWGNKCDLSISGGADNAQTSTDLHKNLDSFRSSLLLDDCNSVWNVLHDARKKKEKVRVDVVLDNSGFELFTDMILIHFMLATQLCDVVVLHPKLMPWFVSDVTPADFKFTINSLESCGSAVSSVVREWMAMMQEERIILLEDEELTSFWSLPYSYHKMAAASPRLYDQLSQSDLIIFKGDLNYRKLVGDLDWPPTTAFKRALRGFIPSNLCSLRTLKANVVVGLKVGVAERLDDDESDWMVTGKYGIIQFCKV